MANRKKKETPDATTPARGKSLSIDTATLPFETAELRRQLKLFLDIELDWKNPKSGVVSKKKLGSFTWGIYAFFDYDDEPIYVGQTSEKISTRVRRHLTNQRTDSVAMGVLDPYEVCKIKTWPLLEFEGIYSKDKTAKAKAKRTLDALEHAVFQQCLQNSKFKAVLNEKAPQEVKGLKVEIPQLCFEQEIVSAAVHALRDHPDLRIARRASTLARLAKVISERNVPRGLRQVLHTQTLRLEALAKIRANFASNRPDEGDDEGED